MTIPYTPRPGVDAMTRDGQRVTGLRDDGSLDLPLVGVIGSTRRGSWTKSGHFWISGLHSNLDLVSEAPPLEPEPASEPEQSGPVRVVIKPEIVPGVYGIVEVRPSLREEGNVSVYITRNTYTADELRAAARTLTTIAEAMK